MFNSKLIHVCTCCNSFASCCIFADFDLLDTSFLLAVIHPAVALHLYSFIQGVNVKHIKIFDQDVLL